MNSTEYQLRNEIRDLRNKMERIEITLRSLIVWMVQSANSPIRPDEAQKLCDMIIENEDK